MDTAIKPSDLPDRLDDNGEPVWETVVEESADTIILEKPGDMFVGRYVGTETIEPEGQEPFTRYTFRDEQNGLKAINMSYKMEKALDTAVAGDMVRITYMKDIPTKRGLNPMKDMRVEVARRRA